jgi:hypothetical protein
MLQEQSSAPVSVGGQPATLYRIPLRSEGMHPSISREGGYMLEVSSGAIYLDSAGNPVEFRDPAGQRFDPRNSRIGLIVERIAASGINQLRPMSFSPINLLSESSPIAILPPSSDAARYLNPFGRQLTPEELEMLEKTGYAAPLDEERQARGLAKKTNSFLGVSGACDDSAFNDAERRGVNRFAFARIDKGFRGKPIETLEELLRTARPGTIIHTSYTGFSGENADGRHQGSHWGVYVGGGVVLDQYGSYTIPEFVKEYNSGRGRKIEALFTHPRM